MKQKQQKFEISEKARNYPMMLVISFAYPCNALCPHCPYTNSNIRKEYKDAPYISEKIFKKIADESGLYNSSHCRRCRSSFLVSPVL